MKESYELAMIIEPDEKVAGEVIEKTKEVLKENSADIKGEEDWKIRQLAYPIYKNRKKFTQGYYYFIKFITEKSNVEKIHEKLRLNEQIIRFLILKAKGVETKK